MLDVCLPGTGGMMPLPERWLSCCWLEYQGKALLIDCGEGTQIALKEAGCKLSRVEFLLVTHYHADHISGLPGFLLTLGNYGRKTPLTILGPKGLQAVVAALTVIAPALPFQIKLVELDSSAPGTYEAEELTISYLPLEHGIPCLGYRVWLNRKPVFNPEKADSLNIPKTMYKLLHAGKSVQLEDGRIIEPEMVLDGERAPISVCYITDTVPTEGMGAFAQGAELLICEGMHGDEELMEKAAEKGHMIFSAAARLAESAGVRRLWLTHFSPAMKEPRGYLCNAAAAFAHTSVGYDGIRTTL